MNINHRLKTFVLAFLLAGISCLNVFGQQATSLKFTVSKKFLERTKSMGLKTRDEKKPYRYPSGSVVGSFHYNYGGKYPSVKHMYENKSWVTSEGRGFTYHNPSVKVTFKTFFANKYEHKSLKTKVKPERTRELKYVKSLGKAPEVNQEDYKLVTHSEFESGRRAGADVERLLEHKSHYLQWVANVMGIRSKGNLSILHSPTGPIKTTTVIRYPYEVERFGKKQGAILHVTLVVSNNINHPSLKRINEEQMESAVFWAIAEATGNSGIAANGDSPTTGGSTAMTQPDTKTEEAPTGSASETDPNETGANHVAGKPPRKPTSPTGGVYGDAMQVLFDLEQVKSELVGLRARIRANVVAQELEQKWLNDAQATLAKLSSDSPHLDEYQDWIEESIKKLESLREEADRLLKEGETGWGKLRSKLDKAISNSKMDKALESDLKAWHKSIDKLQQVSKLELLLAAGRRDKFQALLPAAINDPQLNERAMELQATGYLDAGRYAEALYAVRISSKKYPENPTLRFIMQNIETNYLKLISAKTFDEGQRLRTNWDNYVAGSDRSFALQLFTNGIKRGFHRMVGTTEFREELFKQRVDYAALQQNGIELMWRLRDKGMAFDQIKMLDPESLRKQLLEMAPRQSQIGDDAVEEFMLSLNTAFMHPDVERLMKDNRQLMRVDSEESYLGSDQLETSGMLYGVEAVMDFTSIKNTLMIFGPMARVGGVGSIGRLAQRFGASGTAGRAAAVEQGVTLTAQEWMYARPTIEALAKQVGSTRAGAVLHEAQHALRALRYDSSLPVRWTTGGAMFTTEVAASWLMMDTLGRAGNAVGGEYGQIVGEVASGFIGVPGSNQISKLEDAWQQSLSTMKQARASWNKTEAVLKTLRAPIHEATETIATGTVLSQAQRSALRSATTTLDDLAPSSAATVDAATRASQGQGTVPAQAANSNGASVLVQTAEEEARTLAANARAALAGNTDQALATGAASRTLREQADELASTLNEAENAINNSIQSARRRAQATVQPGNRTAGASSGGGTLLANSRPAAASQSIPTMPRTSQPGFDELIDQAEAALKSKKFDEALQWLNAATRHPRAMSRGDVAEALGKKLAEVKQANRMAKVVAKKARSGSAVLQRLAGEADDAMKPFSQAQKSYINGLKKSDMKALDGAGGALRVSDANGKAIAVWKPAKRAGVPNYEEEGQMIAEVLNSRLAQGMGLRVPFAEPHVVDGEMGVLIRWIPKTTDLSKLKPGAELAFKDQIAKFRPLQILTGNYDVHFGNYKVDAAGRLWAIDAGMSYLKPMPKDRLADIAWQFSGGQFQVQGGASHSVNSARWLRDWYFYHGQNSPLHHSVRRVDELITGLEMSSAAKQLQRVSDPELKLILNEIMESTSRPDIEKMEAVSTILSTLKDRRNNLPGLLNERWAGAIPGG